MSFDDHEYHRRRSEMELECALSTEDQASALAHLELARIHRSRRRMIGRNDSGRGAACGAPIFRTDKEA
jgi:hypothetical protein